MEILADITEAVAFSPGLANFGKVFAGTPKSIPLSITLSPRIQLQGALPQLVSSNPKVRVTAGLPDGVAPAQTGPNVHHYTLTALPELPAGPIAGTVTFAPLAAGAATPEVAQVLAHASVQLAGDVAGRIAAQPNMAFFGTNRAATIHIALTASVAGALQGAKATSPSQWVTARVVPPTAAPAGTIATPTARPAQATAVLELSLDPKTPAGKLDTQVTITTDGGDRLLLPVLAYLE
jgi:hypothetical protein